MLSSELRRYGGFQYGTLLCTETVMPMRTRKQQSPHPHRLSRFLLGCALLMAATAASAEPAPAAVDDLLARNLTPAGVAFEVATRDAEALRWALPQIRRDTARLRARFPGIDIAVVTHGNEQFALTRARETQNAALHADVRALAAGDVPVHVCETFAARRQLAPEDFPPHVQVTAAGPVHVKNYMALGYERVLVRPRIAAAR